MSAMNESLQMTMSAIYLWIRPHMNEVRNRTATGMPAYDSRRLGIDVSTAHSRTPPSPKVESRSSSHPRASLSCSRNTQHNYAH